MLFESGVPGIITIQNPETASAPPDPTTQPLSRKGWQPGPRTRARMLTAAGLAVGLLTVFVYYYFRFARLADEKLEAGVFSSTLNIFAAPHVVGTGDRLSRDNMIAWLRQNGYNMSPDNPGGWYDLRPNALGIFPGRRASSDQDAGVIYFSGGQITRIVSLADHTARQEYQFAPQLIANLSDRNREKRRLVQFSELPPALIDAVVSTEDKHFFSHNGVDLARIVKAAYVDVKDGRKEQGASTLTMQLARGLWLAPDKRWKRKIAELLLTLHLEHKLSKRQIFTYYANQVYMGRRGTFSINGFGEAAHAYFGKNVSQLSMPEAALLAGLVQRPSYYNPFRYPGRALERRNVVLRRMRENGRLTDAQYAAAVDTEIKLAPGGMESTGSQFFLDLANDEVQNRLGEREPRNDYVYTTLDQDLQRAAVEAVRVGMQKVDAQLRKGKHPSVPPGQPQVALIALDPRTGEIKALAGGRDYGASQLDHVTAERQPGSSFKPFVYAAALNTELTGGSQVYTPATTLLDEPTTFQFDNQQYRPDNFKQEFMGTVTLRQALAHSLNAATVKLAQGVGYSSVVDLARMAGFNDNIKPTPAVALGAYVATPLEVAGAYTVFANGGMYVKPAMLASVSSPDGQVLYQHSAEGIQVLDPRVNYLMVNMLEEVLRSGTGAAARSLGFKAPAAGKTGTSHDGWFAGFTSKLLCVVWVGFDDYRSLGLEGSQSALPIWTEFMKRALLLHAYRDPKEFSVPSGVVSAKLCTESHQLAGPDCPSTYTEFFVDGSQPTSECELHSATLPDDPPALQLIATPDTNPQ
ncbi:MAG: penicillin-binding protein 1A [Bryobacteraceae bacterium]